MSEPTWLEPYPDALLEGIVNSAPGPIAHAIGLEVLTLATDRKPEITWFIGTSTFPRSGLLRTLRD